MVTLQQLSHQITKSKLRVPLIWYRHKGINAQDVMVASYPRSGSTWLRFVLYELITGEAAEFDSVNSAIPRPGFHGGAPRLLPHDGRLIQTHEIYRREYRRAVYLIRDVHSVIVSEYYHQLGNGLYQKSFDKFLKSFIQGRVNGYGPWSTNVISWLDAAESNHADILVIKYELMCSDPEMVLARILDFLNIATPKRTIQEALSNNSIQEMKKKEDKARQTVFKSWDENHRFVRSGSVSGWQGQLSESQIFLLEHSSLQAMSRAGYSLSVALETR